MKEGGDGSSRICSLRLPGKEEMRDRELLKGQDATRLILDAKKAPLLAVLFPIGR